MRQFFRWAAVALNRRGYQASGTVMVRPSRMETLKVSFVNFTSVTRSSALTAKMPMPGLQEFRLMLNYQFLKPPQLLGWEAGVPRLCRLTPKLPCRGRCKSLMSHGTSNGAPRQVQRLFQHFYRVRL